MSTRVLITGNTYPVRSQLKALGGVWDERNRGWSVPADKAEHARRMVSGPTASAPRSPRTSSIRPNGMGGICTRCGDDCGGSLSHCGYE